MDEKYLHILDENIKADKLIYMHFLKMFQQFKNFKFFKRNLTELSEIMFKIALYCLFLLKFSEQNYFFS